MENTAKIEPSSSSIPEDLKESLRERLADLTMLPSVATEAIALTNDPDATAREFATVVERDIALATQILAMANSPVCARGRQISSLQQATVRLGFRQCRSLVIASSTACLVKKLDLSDEWVREVIWQHSFRTAAINTELNRQLKLGFDGEEFTAGLLHDFGRLLFAVAANDKFQTFDSLEFYEDDELLTREEEAVGTNHSLFGAWFAEDSGLPENIVDVIRCHHYKDPYARHDKLVSLTIAADDMANHLQRNEVIEEYEPLGNPALPSCNNSAVIRSWISFRKLRIQSLKTQESPALPPNTTKLFLPGRDNEYTYPSHAVRRFRHNASAHQKIN